MALGPNEPDAVELRVLGCLLEKQRTTPDAYPLTLNALRLACNQSTNRTPVVDYDEATIRAALERLARRQWTRAASGAGSRAAKHRQLFDEALGLGAGESAVLTLLMLRGPQTAGELKGRSDRLHRFADLAAIDETLTRLAERGLAEPLERRPGEKQVRWRQSVGGGELAPTTTTTTTTGNEGGGELGGGSPGVAARDGEELGGRSPGSAVGGRGGPWSDEPPGTAAPAGEAANSWESERLARLEAEVARLRAELTSLRDELGA